MFGRKSRAEKLKEQAQSNSLVPVAALSAAYAGARPVAERLLYDDDLRDKLRVFIEAARKILDELSDEEPTEIVTRLWNDDKLRRQVEAAAGAAQEGTKRMRGQRVRSGRRGGRLLFLTLAGATGFLFLNPRTGPQARKFVSEAIDAVT